MNEYKFAPVYDFFVSPYISKIRKEILRISNENKYKNILDVCCGTGNQVRLLRKHGFDATGVDINEDMLKQSGKGFVTPPCYKQDATAMDLPDNSFDMSTITLALHETEPETAHSILREMIRVTRPEGHLILVDYEISNRTHPISHRFVDMVESLVGGNHYRNFRAYRDMGGMNALIKDLQLNEREGIIFRYRGLAIRLLQLAG